MPTSAPSQAPIEIVAGDLVRFTRSYPNYAPSGYAASLHVPGLASFAATPDGDAYLFQIAGATTAAWAASTYQWFIRVTETSGSPPEITTVDTGVFVVSADPASAHSQTGELQQAVTTIANIEAVLASKATRDQKRYKIADRELERMDVSELMQLLGHFQAVRRRIQAGLGVPGQSGKILTRFSAV